MRRIYIYLSLSILINAQQIKKQVLDTKKSTTVKKQAYKKQQEGYKKQFFPSKKQAVPLLKKQANPLLKKQADTILKKQADPLHLKKQGPLLAKKQTIGAKKQTSGMVKKGLANKKRRFQVVKKRPTPANDNKSKFVELKKSLTQLSEQPNTQFDLADLGLSDDFETNTDEYLPKISLSNIKDEADFVSDLSPVELENLENLLRDDNQDYDIYNIDGHETDELSVERRMLQDSFNIISEEKEINNDGSLDSPLIMGRAAVPADLLRAGPDSRAGQKSITGGNNIVGMNNAQRNKEKNAKSDQRAALRQGYWFDIARVVRILPDMTHRKQIYIFFRYGYAGDDYPEKFMHKDPLDQSDKQLDRRRTMSKLTQLNVISSYMAGNNHANKRVTFEYLEKLKRLNGYGCHCSPNGEEDVNMVKGTSGKALDQLDNACHRRNSCYRCIELEYQNCDYRSYYEMSISDNMEITCNDPLRTCERALCDCDKRYFYQRSLYEETFNKGYSMKDGFSLNFGRCEPNKDRNVNAKWGKCCGVGERRQPYSEDLGMRCCNNEHVYNLINGDTCCLDGSVAREGKECKNGDFSYYNL